MKKNSVKGAGQEVGVPARGAKGAQSRPIAVNLGFIVEIALHTNQASAVLDHPESVRFLIGKALDRHGIDEEIDYTLKVSRTYTNDGTTARSAPAGGKRSDSPRSGHDTK